MDREDLMIVELVNGIGATTDKTLQEMMEIGKSIINEFRQNPANQAAMQEVALNTFNENYRISKFGETESMFLFINNILYIFIVHREKHFEKMPDDIGYKFWTEITNFYMTYTMASLYCLVTQMTTMADVSRGLAELRTHFLEVFLVNYVLYLR